jgi:uracil phosphoribosyltransferase
MQLTVVDHPLVAELLTGMRDRNTPRVEFRRRLDMLTTVLVYEALRTQPVERRTVDTPLARIDGVQLTDVPLIVPIMRAGLGMLDATLALLPDACVGFVGVRRDEQTFLPHAYVNTVPDQLGGRRVLVLDPMLATGGSLVHTCRLLRDADAGELVVVCVVAAPDGLRQVDGATLGATIVTAAVDDCLDDAAFIVPGLGDAGDRQFGLA